MRKDNSSSKQCVHVALCSLERSPDAVCASLDFRITLQTPQGASGRWTARACIGERIAGVEMAANAMAHAALQYERHPVAPESQGMATLWPAQVRARAAVLAQVRRRAPAAAAAAAVAT